MSLIFLSASPTSFHNGGDHLLFRQVSLVHILRSFMLITSPFFKCRYRKIAGLVHHCIIKMPGQEWKSEAALHRCV